MNLLYITDPMCSWCYGFAPTLTLIRERFGETLSIRYVMGGLAPDSEEPMDSATQAYVQEAWRAVAARTGAVFDHSFWVKNQPRRSTYPACRAVIAARLQGEAAAVAMFEAIQRAYYREARNPSDVATLQALAEEPEVAVDGRRFARDLASTEVQRLFEQDLALAARTGVGGFPSLVARDGESLVPVSAGYVDAEPLIATLRKMSFSEPA